MTFADLIEVMDFSRQKTLALLDNLAMQPNVQSVLGWYTRTVGEPSISAETYRGHERLFAKESIAEVTRRSAQLSVPR